MPTVFILYSSVNQLVMAKLEKLSDDVFNGKHPNGINKGYTKELRDGIKASIPVVGKNYYFGRLRTSIVKEIVSTNPEKTIFKTRNSTYCITH